MFDVVFRVVEAPQQSTYRVTYYCLLALVQTHRVLQILNDQTTIVMNTDLKKANECAVDCHVMLHRKCVSSQKIKHG